MIRLLTRLLRRTPTPAPTVLVRHFGPVPTPETLARLRAAHDLGYRLACGAAAREEVKA